MVELPLPLLARRADRIVRGQVTAQRSRWDADHRRIYTDVTIVVSRVYKGPPTPVLTVERLGGSRDGIGMRVVGEARFADQEQVLLFLEEAPDGRARTVAMAQGKWRIVGAEVSGELADAHTVGPAVVDRRPQPLAQFEQRLAKALRLGGGGR
jgi:hypothetical protein